MAGNLSSSFHSTDLPVARGARPAVIASLLMAAAVYAIAPILAYNWATRVPFLGVTLEQTFNINDSRGTGWGPSPNRLDVQDHIGSIDGRRIDSQAVLEQALAEAGARGEMPAQIVFERRTPGGAPETRTISLRLTPFPPEGMVRMLWLPYGIGLVYLGVGAWVFRTRGHQRAGLPQDPHWLLHLGA